MTPRELELVKSSFARAAAARPCVGIRLYSRLFQTRADLEQLFRSDRAHQAHTVVQMLEAIVACLEVRDKIVPLLYELGRRHTLYHVKEEHYAAFGDALIVALHDCLPGTFSAEEEQAWKSAYSYMAEIMKEALPASSTHA